jgi:hypothetical protein
VTRIGGDTQVPSITSQDLKRYLVWKTTEYVPIRKNGKTHPLSPKKTRNIYVTFQAFFRWIGEEFEPRDLGCEERSRGKFPSPMKGITAPKFVSPPIEPFTKDEVVAMVKGCVQKRESRPSNRKAFTTRWPYTLRDQTVFKFLLMSRLRDSLRKSLNLRQDGICCRRPNKWSCILIILPHIFVDFRPEFFHASKRTSASGSLW